MPLFSDPAIVNNIDCDQAEYCHQFIPGDKIYLQFYQTPCGVNQICDPLFTDVTVGADLLGGDGMGGTIVCGNWTASGTWSCSAFYLTKTAGASAAIAYSGVGMTVGKYYRVTFSTNRTAGSFQVVLGVGGDATTSAPFEVTGNGYYVDLYFNDAADDVLSFLADADFDGTITDVTVKELTYACWTPDAVWNFSSDGACKSDDTTAGTLTESVANYTTVNGYYQLSFTISNYISGTLIPKVAGVTDQDTTVISANGNYTLYFETGASGVVSFESSTDFVGCISAPDLRELRNDYLAEIRDSETQFLYYEIPFTYYHQYVTAVYDIAEESQAVDVDGLQPGCYRIHVYDYCVLEEEQLTNGNLSGGSGTTPPDGWFGLAVGGATISWNSNQFSATITAGGQSPRFRNVTPLELVDGQNYELSFEIVSIDPGLTVSASWDNTYNSGTFNTVGVKTFAFTYNAATAVDGFVRIFVLDAGAAYPATAVIDNLSLVAVVPFQASYISECFQYRDTLNNSKLFQGYCDSASLGFDFVNTGFKLSERLVCRSFAPTYEVDRKTFNYGSGRSAVYYAEFQKWIGVYLDAVPETVHDTMAAILNCDNFEIGANEGYLSSYVAKPDDYTPEWERSGLHSLATVRFDVKPKEGGQFFNRDC